MSRDTQARLALLVFKIEVVCGVTLSTGVGLFVAAFTSLMAGIGAGLVALATIGFLMVIAFQRGD